MDLFTIAHREFYETIDRYRITSEYVDEVAAMLPDGWVHHRHSVWLGVQPVGHQTVAQGFKIHLTSIPLHARRVLRLVVPELVARGISFKCAADPTILNLLISKRYGRGGSGKFMTIYPPDEDAFRELIEALHQKTRGEDLAGPYILSDRRYSDSRILFYRYGGFRSIDVLQADGARQPHIISPDGTLVPDVRTPFFQLPDWVADPFGGTRALEHDGSPVLQDRYRVDGVLAFTNGGGIYAGTDLQTDAEIVIKEARPFSNHWPEGDEYLDAVRLLERERAMLDRLAHLDFVPRVVAHFREWEHWFLVQERRPGGNFQSYWAHPENILAPYIRTRPERIGEFGRKLRPLVRRLIEMVGQVHEAGVMIGDVSPNNVLLDDATLQLSMIDFEGAVLREGDAEFMRFARSWLTPGFGNPDRRTRDHLLPEDDFYAIGMLVFGTVVNVQAFTAINAGALELFMDRFVSLGIPEAWRATVRALQAGDTELALAVIDEWEAADKPAAEPAMADVAAAGELVAA
jgi:hypothetical protein